MNVTDSKNLPTQYVDWAHFDGSVGSAKITDRQVIEGTYTFGPSNKCRMTMEFTGFKLPGYTHGGGDPSVDGNAAVEWAQIQNADAVFSFNVGSGNFNLEEADRPTSSINYSHQGAPLVSFPIYTGTVSDFPNLEAEVFVLTMDLDRTTIHPNFTVDMRSDNIVIIDAASYVSIQPTDIQTPATVTFRCGARLVPMSWNDSAVAGDHGPVNITVTKFCCVDVA